MDDAPSPVGTLWDPDPAPPEGEPGPFGRAVTRDLHARAEDGAPVGEMAKALMLALAQQIDRLSTWLARRPEARPADRLALAKLLAQLESTYERSIGPARHESRDELGAIVDAFRTAEAGHAQGPRLAN